MALFGRRKEHDKRTVQTPPFHSNGGPGMKPMDSEEVISFSETRLGVSPGVIRPQAPEL